MAKLLIVVIAEPSTSCREICQKLECVCCQKRKEVVWCGLCHLSLGHLSLVPSIDHGGHIIALLLSPTSQKHTYLQFCLQCSVLGRSSNFKSSHFNFPYLKISLYFLPLPWRVISNFSPSTGLWIYNSEFFSYRRK